MKPLKSSMREKKRYLLVKGKIDDIEKAILNFIGVLGMSKVCLIWIKKNKDRAIISVNRDSVNHVRASFAAWPEEIQVIRVSGTLKGLRKIDNNF
jgi:RNase P/RNase MRP subunit POP5